MNNEALLNKALAELKTRKGSEWSANFWPMVELRDGRVYNLHGTENGLNDAETDELESIIWDMQA